MSRPILPGVRGSCGCEVSSCWLICNVPMVGAVPFPDLGNLAYTWSDPRSAWEWQDDTSEHNVPVLDNLGGIEISNGRGTVTLADWATIGDARTPMRNLKMVITLSTTATFDSGQAGYKAPWNDGMPDQGTTGDRIWEWTFLWSPMDKRLQSVQGKLTCDADGGWRTGKVFYDKQLLQDNDYSESGNDWGSGGEPDSKLNYALMAAEPQTSVDQGGAATIQALGNTYTFQGAFAYLGTAFSTNLTVAKSIPQTMAADPEDLDEATYLVTFADHTLANYDLAKLSRSYTFWEEDDGNGDSVQKTVAFKPHHGYYIWPFCQKVDGHRTKTIRWACLEPIWEMWWASGPPTSAPWIAPDVRNPNGIFYAGPNEELWVHNYNTLGATEIKLTQTYGVLNNRDLPRFGCVRRTPVVPLEWWFGPSSTDPRWNGGGDLASNIWVRNADPVYFGALDPLYDAANTLANFTDYLEVSKCSFQVLTGDACLVQFAETSVGSPRLAWASDAGGQSPAITGTPGPCSGSQPTGNYFFDRNNLSPTLMGLGFVLRSDQICMSIEDGSTSIEPPTPPEPIFYQINEDTHANWPDGCEEPM